MATVQLGLTVVCDVSAMLAGISAGRLVAVHSGDCDVSVTLAIDEAEVATRQARLALPGVITVHRGIRLLPASAYPPATEQAETADDHSPRPQGNPSLGEDVLRMGRAGSGGPSSSLRATPSLVRDQRGRAVF